MQTSRLDEVTWVVEKKKRSRSLGLFVIHFGFKKHTSTVATTAATTATAGGPNFKFPRFRSRNLHVNRLSIRQARFSPLPPLADELLNFWIPDILTFVFCIRDTSLIFRCRCRCCSFSSTLAGLSCVGGWGTLGREARDVHSVVV